ncbi:lipopolysaccharide biosynthesis protein [Salipaludibacillus daqingensis]|uniref:lipopolysaccharide biosynthesis protein n=1 Tax=Salipaludibacillus daqingensis TaxID=3041001 RepID=UPI0024741DF6|nr:hypothetical protein [Salipaludibacillus daqingensis]
MKKLYIKKIRKISGDMLVNIFATIIPVLVLQFALLPIVAGRYDDANYGLALVLISLITISAQSFSVSLGNSRLLLNDTYVKLNKVGDFNVLLIAYCIINIILLSIGTYLYEGFLNPLNVGLIVSISIFQLVRRYLLVSFRLKIYFKGILYSNIILVIGYMVGMILFLLTDLWQLIYLTGELISLIYVMIKTKLLREPFEITQLFKRTTKHSLVILIAALLGTANTQIDKLILFPILGAKMVAVYHISTLFGKTLSMGVAPINNVLLTYLSKMNHFKIGYFKMLLFTASILGVLSYYFVILVSEPILTFLYPSYAQEALELIYITTSTAIITMVSTVINPVIMKFCNITWQIWLNIINIVTFVTMAFFLVQINGILGFCYAALIASIIKLIIMIAVYYKKAKTPAVTERAVI